MGGCPKLAAQGNSKRSAPTAPGSPGTAWHVADLADSGPLKSLASPCATMAIRPANQSANLARTFGGIALRLAESPFPLADGIALHMAEGHPRMEELPRALPGLQSRRQAIGRLHTVCRNNPCSWVRMKRTGDGVWTAQAF